MSKKAHFKSSLTMSATGLFFLVAMSGTATAAPRSTNAKVNPGPISMSAMSVADFPATTLDGKATAVTSTMDPFTVTDSRGNGFGWNVTVQASQLAEWDPATNAFVTGGRTIALNSLELPTPEVTADGTDSPPPQVMEGPHPIDTSAAVKVASAAADTGMGKYVMSVPQPMRLTLPANAYAGTYRSVVTVSVVSGP